MIEDSKDMYTNILPPEDIQFFKLFLVLTIIFHI